MAVDTLLSRLDGVKQTGPDRWIANAPTRDERTPSLAIRALDDGRVLLHDFGGDDTESILSALGLTFDDLFPEKLPRHHGKPERRPFPATDLLKLIAHEALIAAVAAGDMRRGENLAPYDLWRVGEAERRIYNALRAGGLRK